jgi:hypothetical protein
MADKGFDSRSPIKDFGWLAIFLVVLGVIWFAQGGPSRLSSITSPYLKSPSAPSSSSGGKITAPPAENTFLQKTLPNLQDSPYKGKVSLSASAARQNNPQKEYLEIRAHYNNAESILITGWTLKGTKGETVSIGKGAYLPYSAQVNLQDPILLEKGGKAIIVTGQSPIGTSFRLNICTGYFNQFQTFYPSLPEECPRISQDEVPIDYPDACFNFVRSLSTCRMPLSSVPAAAGNDCATFISRKANYNGCVVDHKNDANFYKSEWRIYLGRSEELWGNERDTIILLDQEGKLVDYVSY